MLGVETKIDVNNVSKPSTKKGIGQIFFFESLLAARTL